MNPDTERSIQKILSQGYYPEGQTLGEGGWEHVLPLVKGWKRYVLHIPYETIPIIARDDASAIQAFHGRYYLEDVPYEIREEIVTYRTVQDNIYDQEDK